MKTVDTRLTPPAEYFGRVENNKVPNEPYNELPYYLTLGEGMPRYTVEFTFADLLGLQIYVNSSPDHPSAYSLYFGDTPTIGNLVGLLPEMLTHRNDTIRAYANSFVPSQRANHPWLENPRIMSPIIASNTVLTSGHLLDGNHRAVSLAVILTNAGEPMDRELNGYLVQLGYPRWVILNTVAGLRYFKVDREHAKKLWQARLLGKLSYNDFIRTCVYDTNE